jgi:hypothetical protein
MIGIQRLYRAALSLLMCGVAFFAVTSARGQVSPEEIGNPRLRIAEEKYFPQLHSIQQSIAGSKFPFQFKLARYLKAKPGQREAADSNGIEFVYFQERVVLKISGIYKAAYNPTRLTRNERADRVFEDIVIPMLRLVAKQIPKDADFEGVGFEIIYDTRNAGSAYDYEGKEVLTAVFDRDDAVLLANATVNSDRQQILNHSEAFLNGEDLGLALGQHDSLNVEALNRSLPRHATEVPTTFHERAAYDADVSTAKISPALSVTQTIPGSTSAPSFADAMRLQSQFQPQLNAIVKEEGTRFHLEEGTAPAFEIGGNQTLLHLTLRNTLSFEKSTTSIYRRAAQSFDLFLAPELRELTRRLPENGEFDALELSVLNHLGSERIPSETIDYICPLDSMRQFVANRISSQDLINQSVVLVNGVRIGLNLQLVE